MYQDPVLQRSRSLQDQRNLRLWILLWMLQAYSQWLWLQLSQCYLCGLIQTANLRTDNLKEFMRFHRLKMMSHPSELLKK